MFCEQQINNNVLNRQMELCFAGTIGQTADGEISRVDDLNRYGRYMLLLMLPWQHGAFESSQRIQLCNSVFFQPIYQDYGKDINEPCTFGHSIFVSVTEELFVFIIRNRNCVSFPSSQVQKLSTSSIFQNMLGALFTSSPATSQHINPMAPILTGAVAKDYL